MGYVFGNPDEHCRAVIDILHRMRWDEEMPDSFEGLDWNLLLETAVDTIHNLISARDEAMADLKSATASYRHATDALIGLAQYDMRWKGQHPNDAPGRERLIHRAYDALWHRWRLRRLSLRG